MGYYFYGCNGDKFSCKKIIKRFSDLKIVHLYNSIYIVPMNYKFLEDINSDNVLAL
ncbi:MAG: hypothetical protein JXA99_08740 [Candidatus Lokiarchaeota archaeon]|nr:hypothetical protein [Candidatus Lokiarchaeota archaeon]